MALNNPHRSPEKQTEIPGSESESVEIDPKEVDNLESEVKEMSQKILHFRSTLSDKLKDTFASILEAQRPIFSDGSEPGTSQDPNSGAERAVTSNVPAAGDEETREKIRLLKEKISSNVSAMPIVLKRIRECISKIDKLDSLDSQYRTIHPAFKRKRTRD
ncbi:hypothetical protein UlMin_028411 [Ulmus minor]